MALKKVIAQMTLGKDLSALFQSVLKCLEYSELDIKKLVYLYIINYSRSKPDEAIMTISSFRKDAANKSNPIIALAVRTMSSLRVPKLNEYLVEPLKIALNDEDPYVRKTAVLSIPKVY
jgi:AP-1 complex subunit beta-1